jgi:CBS domain-containing protein
MSVVREIMTPELFTCIPGESAAGALDYLVMLNLHAAPVLAEQTHEPVGMIALSDLTGELGEDTVESRMSYPAAFVLQTAPVGEAARIIAHTGFHHLVVVDGEHRAVGFVSAVDVIRALQGWTRPGAPPAEPAPASPELEWSGQEMLSETGILAAPEGAGIFVLLRVPDDLPATVLWAQSSKYLRARLGELLADPPPRLARYLERGHLKFRAAAVPDDAHRRAALASVLGGRLRLESPGGVQL